MLILYSSTLRRSDPEEEATTYVGVMQAIVSIFADEGDRIRYIDAGNTKIAFLLKAPLYLCCVSSWGEPESIVSPGLGPASIRTEVWLTLSTPIHSSDCTSCTCTC